MDCGGIWPHTLSSEDCAIKGNLRPADVALGTVEDNIMVLGSLHQVQEMLIVLLRGMAEYTYIIMNGDNAR